MDNLWYNSIPANNSISYDRLNNSVTLGMLPLNNRVDALKMKDSEINNLKKTINIYKKNTLKQNEKISSQDHLYIEYNSMKKNYIELEKILNQYKIENANLKNIIKEQYTINEEFQKIFKDSKEKFNLFEQKNNTLKSEKIELEGKLRTMEIKQKNYNDSLKRIKDLEKIIENINNDKGKNEEILKLKISHLEKSNKSALSSIEDELSDYKIKNEKYKIENEKLKIEITNLKLQIKDIQEKNKFSIKDAQNEKLRSNKNMNKLQNEINELNIKSNEVSLSHKKEVNILIEKTAKLESEIKSKQQEIEDLCYQLKQAEMSMIEAQKEITKRNIKIESLINENQKLNEHLNDQKNEILQYKNSSENKIEILAKKLQSIQNEKDRINNDKLTHLEEIDNLNKKLIDANKNNQLVKQQYVDTNDILIKNSNEWKNKENNLTTLLQNKDVIIQEKESEFEYVKAKLDSKIQRLTLENASLNDRIKNLINTLIQLKDYAMSVERNVNTVPQEHYNTFSDDSRYNDYSNNLINGMKDMIRKIDDKLGI